MTKWNEDRPDAVAVIGAAARFPGAVSLDAFWDAVRTGRNCTTDTAIEDLRAGGVPDADLGVDGYITAMGRLDDVMAFDAGFFGISAHEAELMDPQQRKFLECAYEALESAGYAPGVNENRVGVYASASHSSYLPSAILGAGTARVTEALQMAIGNDRDYLATRISNLLDLTGPSLTVQTACSSSLTAIHLACQSLLAGECDMALAGGVSITLPQVDGYRHREGLILSRSGVCRPFDAQADGTVNGNGVGIILLKPLDAALRDGDAIHAIVRGTAVNNDGASKVGYTAPSVHGEAAAVAEALGVSCVLPEKIEFISTHGTATAIGDPIEIEALTRALETSKREYCTLGAIKANIGHLDAAAGIAGFMVAMLALEKAELPPIANFSTPNPALRLNETPFVIRKTATRWTNATRYAMANAFGFGGTNVSIVLESAPEVAEPNKYEDDGPFILPLSAHTQSALDALVDIWRQYAAQCPHLLHACWTAACRRSHRAYRMAFVGKSRAELVAALAAYPQKNVLGQNAQENTAIEAVIPAATLLQSLCHKFGNARETIGQYAAEAAMDLETALGQQKFCADALDKFCQAMGVEPLALRLTGAPDADAALLHFLQHVASAYASGKQIGWAHLLDGRLTRIPLTPFSRATYCHALAQRREYVPHDPVEAAQVAAARMAATAGHVLEPHMLVEREALLENLCAGAVARAFARLGFPSRAKVAQALEAMRIPLQLSQLVERLLLALHEKGLLRRDGDFYHDLAQISEAAFSELEAETQPVWEAWGAMESVVLSTAERLPDLLTGQLDLRETFMPRGNLSGARRVYSELPNSVYFNALVREHVREWLEKTASGEAVRIFEIGGGTAATAERILPLLPPDRSTYMFTDVSPVFLKQAKQRFSEYGFLRTGLFNMEDQPEIQGFETGIYDIVIAANVLHAAKDLSVAVRHAASLLRPGGMLLLYEITRANFLGEITTGLLLPDITDCAVRGIQPMASNKTWESVLAASGFGDIQILPRDDQAEAALPDRVLSARYLNNNVKAEAVLPAWCTYQTVWEPMDITGNGAKLGRILLLATHEDAPQFAAEAKKRGLALTLVPAECTVADLREWTDRQALCTVLDARALSETTHSTNCAEQERLCGGMLHLLSLFTARELGGTKWQWATLTKGAARTVLHPAQATYWGMNRVVSMGHPELGLRQFDLADASAGTISTLFDLLESGESEELNAIDGGQWLVPRLERRAIADIPPCGKTPDTTGWQVIVGGLGGIGMALARELVSQGFLCIALLSRRAPGPEELQAIAEIEKSGAQGASIVCVQADVTDYSALALAAAHLESQAAIRAVYHCAVVKRVSGADERDPWPAFWQIMAPKVLGAWNLHRLSEERKLTLDRMVFFSSSVSIAPPYSLPHYVAANTYLDALARWRRNQGLPALSISWGAWKDIGTVSDPAQADHLRNGGLYGFSPAEGMALLNAVLGRDTAHLGVMKVDWSRLLRQYGERVPAYFSRFCSRGAAQSVMPSEHGVNTANPVAERSHILSSLRSAKGENERRSMLEAWLKERFASLLKTGAESIDRTASLFDLGVDSLMFIEMTDGLEKDLDIKISPSSLLQNFTVENIAAKLLPDLKLGSNTTSSLAELFIPEPHKRYEPFSLTDVQRAYWIGRRQEMALGNTACQGYIEFDCENLDVERLQSAWQRLIARHDTLRTVIGEDGLQRVLEHAPDFSIAAHDLTGLTDAERNDALAGIRGRLSHKVHDPMLWPLFDVEVSLLSGNMRRLHVLMDNVVMDGRSISILLAEWAALYHNPDHPLPPQEISFRDYISALERYRKTEAYQQAEAYWDAEAKLLPPAPELPLAKQPECIEKPRFARHDYRMAPDLWQALKVAAGRHGVTFSSVLLTAYADVLGLWSRSSSLTVNAPVFTRLPFHPAVNNVLGEFTSSILVRCETGRGMAFADKVKAVQQRVFDGLKYCQVSGVEVMRRKIRDGASSRSVRMPVVFTSTFGLAKKADTGFASSIEGFSSLGREVFNISQTPQVWIDNHVHDRDGTLSIYWDVVEELFPAGMIDSMFAAYCGMLERLAKDDAAWIADVPAEFEVKVEQPLPLKEKAQLLHAGFVRNAAQYPDRTAVIDADRVMTYGELFREAATLAGRIAALVAPKSHEIPLVAVALPRGHQQAVAVLAVLFAGAAYVPIDPDWPLPRRKAVLDEARPACVVSLMGEDAANWNALPICPVLDPVAENCGQHMALDALLRTDPGSLAYVIFTSGTTGVPKGVMMSHAAAMATIDEINRRFCVTERDRVLALSALTFDLSVYDFFGIWAAGGGVVMLRESTIRRLDVWRALMEQHGVTVWNSVPMFWQMLLESGEIPQTPPRLAFLSGDSIPVSLPAESAKQFPTTHMVSLGGATEAGIWSICHEMAPDDPQPGWQSIPYGKALAGQSFQVRHEDMRICPEHVAGELYIGGAALALGYLHNPELTAARFVHSPSGGERLYKTGDMGVRHADGAIEFLGRLDTQVKVGGFRIELGDVEAALAALPDVALCAAVLAGAGQLAAFVVPANTPSAPTAEALQKALGEALPRYMVPALIRVVDRMPLTPNGKIDRRALAELAGQAVARAQGSVPSSTSSYSSSEAMLCDVWREVLGVPVAPADNVFALGADSLGAVRAEALVKKRYGLKLPLQTVFDHPVVSEMANCLDEHLLPDVGTLRSSASSEVLFCLGDAVTDGSSFHDFARYWPLGSVKTVSVMPMKSDTLETAVARLCRHISLAQPQGPLRVAGYCAGGLLAWLVAEHLQEMGRVVDRLVLIDCMPLPPGIHNNASMLEGIVLGMAGHSSPELLENLGGLCALLEGAEYKKTAVPSAFVESQEIVGQGQGFEFWRNRAGLLHKIPSPGTHADCLKRKQLLVWLGEFVDWFETAGEAQHV